MPIEGLQICRSPQRRSSKQSKTIFCQLNITDSDCVSRKRDGWWVCSNLRPMSHLRFYRAILSHVCATLRLCRVNKHGFCTTYPVSLSSFTSTVLKWWNCSICNLFFWTLWLIVCFRLARQPTKTKLLGLARISWSVMLVWFVYATKSQRATAQSCARLYARSTSRDKIAGVTSA